MGFDEQKQALSIWPGASRFGCVCVRACFCLRGTCAGICEFACCVSGFVRACLFVCLVVCSLVGWLVGW